MSLLPLALLHPSPSSLLPKTLDARLHAAITTPPKSRSPGLLPRDSPTTYASISECLCSSSHLSRAHMAPFVAANQARCSVARPRGGHLALRLATTVRRFGASTSPISTARRAGGNQAWQECSLATLSLMVHTCTQNEYGFGECGVVEPDPYCTCAMASPRIPSRDCQWHAHGIKIRKKRWYKVIPLMSE